MRLMNFRSQSGLFLCAFVLVLDAACSALPIPDSPASDRAIQTGSSVTSTPTRSPAQPTPTPTPTPLPIQWTPLAAGIDRTYLEAISPVSGGAVKFYVLRLDPAQVTFRVHHDSQEAHLMDEWRGLLDEEILINGGFFSADNTPTGRIILDGEQRGFPLDYGPDSIGVPGLFAVRGKAVWLYSLGRDDFNPQGMRFDQALESYPMLVLPGGKATYPVDTGKRARRTIIGIDEEGYVIILLIDSPVFSLYEISGWLADSNLRLDTALNLDGGRSSGLSVKVGNENKLISSFVPVPIVLGISISPDK
jgi:uncharacterized protein YigE (DUF2233 family)